ncbi:MAG: hypothetical protein ACI9K2_007454 [Myxococcota bacterium]
MYLLSVDLESGRLRLSWRVLVDAEVAVGAGERRESREKKRRKEVNKSAEESLWTFVDLCGGYRIPPADSARAHNTEPPAYRPLPSPSRL